MLRVGGGRNLSSGRGFTLAEVLVTLGIIGVVSAMTVPALIQNHQRKAYVTQLHKFYNELSQALTQYQTDNNAVNLKEAGLNSQAGVNSFIKKYFKIVAECDTISMSPCFAETYKKMNGLELKFTNDTEGIYTLASGQSIRVSYSGGVYTITAGIIVDVNGQKGPNIQGRDVFEIFIYDTSSGWFLDDLNPLASVVSPLSDEERENQFTKYCLGGIAGNHHGCFGKILKDNWEMTY